MQLSRGFIGARCGGLGVFLVCVHLLSISLRRCEEFRRGFCAMRRASSGGVTFVVGSREDSLPVLSLARYLVSVPDNGDSRWSRYGLLAL